MPTYEYRCKACGNELEVVQSFTDAALKKCPACGKLQLRKVFGAVGISFKGSGFYKNDSRGSSSSSSSGSESSTESSTTDSKGSSSTESSSTSSKPAAKSDSKSA